MDIACPAIVQLVECAPQLLQFLHIGSLLLLNFVQRPHRLLEVTQRLLKGVDDLTNVLHDPSD